MKTLRNVMACALLLAAFAACTDDFATPDARGEASSIIGGEQKPDPGAATAAGNVSNPGDDKKDDVDATAGDDSEIGDGK